MKMDNFRPFIRLTAICSLLGALTTALLLFLPNPAAPDFESQVLLSKNGMYMAKLWILFLHPQVNLLASFGIAFLLFRKYPLQIVVGTLFLTLWAFSEMTQQGLLIDALNQIWRPGYLGAEEETNRETFRVLIEGAKGLSDSKYFLVIYGFGLGSLLFGLAFVQENGMAKWIGWALLFIGILSLSSFARYYLEVSLLNVPVNWSYKYIYPYLQPLVRIAIGIWIFLEINKRTGISK